MRALGGTTGGGRCAAGSRWRQRKGQPIQTTTVSGSGNGPGLAAIQAPHGRGWMRCAALTHHAAPARFKQGPTVMLPNSPCAHACLRAAVVAEQRAACNLVRKTGKAPPPPLTATQRQLLERLIAAHGDDTEVRRCCPPAVCLTRAQTHPLVPRQRASLARLLNCSAAPGDAAHLSRHWPAGWPEGVAAAAFKAQHLESLKNLCRAAGDDEGQKTEPHAALERQAAVLYRGIPAPRGTAPHGASLPRPTSAVQAVVTIGGGSF